MTTVKRIAIVDFDRVRSDLELSLSVGCADLSAFLDCPPPSEGEKKEHICDIENKLKELDILIKDSESIPYRFNSEYDIPKGLVERSVISYKNKGEYWIFRGKMYLANGPNTEDEFRLLVHQQAERERRKFQSLDTIYNSEEKLTGVEEKPARLAIPTKVRHEVWRRDEGRCVKCGSRSNLEFDHIIPVIEGGSNTTRNIELLCELCNRSKGKNIE